MPVQTISEGLDNLYTTTWQNMKSQVIDQIFDGHPFWMWIKERRKSVQGGRFLTEPLRYAKHELIGFIGRGGTVPLNDNEFLTVLTEDWKYMYASIVRFWTDDQKNRSKNQIINWMTAKLDNLKESQQEKMEEILFTDNSANALSFNGLPTLIDTTPATGTVHGISGDNYTWWRNQADDMTGLSFSLHGVPHIRTMLNNCQRNVAQDRPDFMITTQQIHEWYEDTVVEQKRIVNQKLGDAGFENVVYKGVPLTWSTKCPSGRIYFINSRYLVFQYDPMAWFDMTEWKSIPNSFDRAAQTITAGNLMVSKRRCQGVIYNLTTE